MHLDIGQDYRYCGLHRYCSGHQMDVCTVVATGHPVWGARGVQVRFPDHCVQIVLRDSLSPLAGEEG